jgi:biofilm PGA synthesis N-glycosyltransferase PgaC
MKLLFWVCAFLVLYAYFGYAVYLWLLVRFRRLPSALDAKARTVSIIIAARNEAKNLSAKLGNIRALNYPAELMQIIVASDGSTDETAALLLQREDELVPVILNESRGKAVALNAAVEHATGEILVFFDVRQSVDAGAVEALVARFADPKVGAVSGELVLESADDGPADGVGLYWTIEKMVRRLESESGSVVGATGAIYAIRRELYRSIPAGTILDDVYVPMRVALAGYRVVFEPLAIARDRVFSQKGKEFLRKVRTLTGNYQLLQLSPWMLTWSNPLLFRLISHKLIRLVVPVFLIGTLAASLLAGGTFFRMVFLLQIAFYALAVAGWFVPGMKRFKPIAIANTFVMLNAAAVRAFYNFVVGRNSVWV